VSAAQLLSGSRRIVVVKLARTVVKRQLIQDLVNLTRCLESDGLETTERPELLPEIISSICF